MIIIIYSTYKISMQAYVLTLKKPPPINI